MVFLPQTPESSGGGFAQQQQQQQQQQEEEFYKYQHNVKYQQHAGAYPGMHGGHNLMYHAQAAQNMILVQVNPGETFTIQGEDGTYRSISGPAQVPMVSHNGAIPPIYVPPGYVSQVIEENGVRRVVVLPADPTQGFHPVHGLQQSIHPIFIPPTVMPRPDFQVIPRPLYPEHAGAVGANSPDVSGSAGFVMPVVGGQPDHDADQTASAPAQPDATTSSSVTSSPASHCSPTGSPDVTSSPQHRKDGGGAGGGIYLSSPRPIRLLPGGNHQFVPVVHHLHHSVAPFERPLYHPPHHVAPPADAVDDCPVGDGDEVPVPGYSNLQELLTAISQPEVLEVDPRSAKLTWSPPPIQTDQLDDTEDSPCAGLEPPTPGSDLVYELQLLNHKKDDCFHTMYRGAERTFHLVELRPAAEYQVRVNASFKSEVGDFSHPTSFRTLPAEPDAPQSPKFQGKTKNSLLLKWTSPVENGEKIVKYHVEWNRGETGADFCSLAVTSQKQYKATKLTPARAYSFRLAAENKIGISRWSPAVSCITSGTAPPAPEGPRLTKAMVKSLWLGWSRPPGCELAVTSGGGLKYSLEMDDESTGYGFRPIYDGAELKYQVKGLARSSHYKFRLSAYNNDGRSKWSETVSYVTCPDKPQSPGKPQLRHAQPRALRVSWDAPKDTGGSDVQAYMLEMCAAADGDQRNMMAVVYTGPANDFVVDDLQPGHTYRLRVSCQTNGGLSLPSDVTAMTTLPVAPGACAAPMLAARPKSTCLSVKWEAPAYTGGAAVTSYQLTCAVSRRAPVDPADHVVVHEGEQLEATVPGLEPGMEHVFAVRALNRAGMGPWSDGMRAVTSAGVPDKPELPQATVLSPHHVLLEWQAPVENGSAISGYRVQWGSESSSLTTLDHAMTSSKHNFHHLHPNTTYFFAVQAVNAVGASAPSETCTCATAPSHPAVVARLRRHQPAAEPSGDEEGATAPPGAVWIRWDAPDSHGADIGKYVVRVVGGEPGSQDVEVDGDTTQLCMDDLLPDTTYSIQVCAVNEMGPGAFCSPHRLRTKPLPPDAPSLACQQACPTSLKLTWVDNCSNPHDRDVQYLLQMRDKFGRYSTIYSGSNQTKRVNRLSENTLYQFRISASNVEGQGPFSRVYAFTTKVQTPAAVEAPVVSKIEATSCDVTWSPLEPIRGDSIEYRLSVEVVGKSSLTMTYQCENTSYVLDRLQPDHQYRLSVAALRQMLRHPVAGSDDSSSSATEQPSPPPSGGSSAPQTVQGPFSASCAFTTSPSDVTMTSSPDASVMTSSVADAPPRLIPKQPSQQRNQRNAAQLDLVRNNSLPRGGAQERPATTDDIGGQTADSELSDVQLSGLVMSAFVLSAMLLALVAQYIFVK